MKTDAPVFNAKLFICIAAVAAIVALSGPAEAGDRTVIVRIPVESAGLDLNQAADARELFRRLGQAARIACGRGNQVGLEPPASHSECYEQALGGAVRSIHRQQLSNVYLATHTYSDAAKHDIEVPAQIAAK
jgi:UrcA family protein